MTTIACISDTHNLNGGISVPDADILVHAGDLTLRGTMTEVIQANKWLAALPHKVISICGNHDFGFQREPSLFRSLMSDVIYLQDEAAEVDGLKFYGSPWQPWFFNWAFNAVRGEEIRRHWSKIPDDVDVLIVHGPAYGILDKVKDGSRVGCEDLLDALRRVKPKLFVFGHIHESAGRTVFRHDDGRETICVNAAQVDLSHRPNNNIQVVEL